MNLAKTPLNRPDRFLIIALTFSLLANVGMMLVMKQKQGFSLHGGANGARTKVLPDIGTRFDALQLVALDGSRSDLKFGPGELPVVAYVLSPSCGWCKFNRKNIESLVNQKQGKFRFVGISTSSEGLSQYVTKYSPPFPVYTVDPSLSHRPINLSTTPETLVFSSQGTYLTGWEGAYIGETHNAITSYFGVNLPQ